MQLSLIWAGTGLFRPPSHEQCAGSRRRAMVKMGLIFEHFQVIADVSAIGYVAGYELLRL